MNTETKTCQNCKVSFAIDAQDFYFYKKMDVPPPTWCPDCRLQRRLVWRNEYKFYKRKCDAQGHNENLITIFSPDRLSVIYDPTFWWSDGWDAIEYGRDYDFSRPFLEQFRDLTERVPRPALVGEHATMIRSEYSNWAGHLKNCYLITDADYVEDSSYGSGICRSKDCFDNDFVLDSQLCYYNFDIEKCYRTFFSVSCKGSNDIYFSKNCIGCNNCFGCSNLRNKSYCIFNEQYSKEEYLKKFAEFDLASYKNINALKTSTKELWLKFPQKYIRGFYNSNVKGDYIYNSRNTFYGFLVTDVQDSKYVALTHAKPTKGCYDYTDWGENAENIYEGMSVGLGAYNIKFSHFIFKEIRDIEYSYLCMTSSNCFGCVGVRNKKFCILNKQYTEDEYKSMIPKIIAHMNEKPYVDRKGRIYKYGEFFPSEISVFAYNESIAQEYFPLTKDMALKEGYDWKEEESRNYSITIFPRDLPDRINDVQDSVIKEIIGCEHEGKCNDQCTTAFRITPDELNFYRRMTLPLPRLCPNCRHYERIKQRNPMRLWHRHCDCERKESTSNIYKNTTPHFHGEDKCPIEFETSFSPDRSEIVYCEQCYTSEVT